MEKNRVLNHSHAAYLMPRKPKRLHFGKCIKEKLKEKAAEHRRIGMQSVKSVQLMGVLA